MALTRINSFATGSIVTNAIATGEFDNIYNNALTLISPLTGDLAFGGNILTGLGLGAGSSPAIQFTGDTNTGMYSAGADVLDLVVGGIEVLTLRATATTGIIATNPSSNITATANTDTARFFIGSANTLVIPTGTTAIAAGLWIAEPNLTATGTITRASAVYVADAPTEGGTANYAVWVDAGNVRLDGGLDVAGATTLNGAVTLGDAAADNITVTGTITSNLIFTDNSYDIGASGATRPRHIYQSGNLVTAGTATVTGLLTASNALTVSAGALTVSGVGPHAIGGAVDATYQVRLRGTFNSGSGSPIGLGINPTLVGQPGGDAYGFYVSPTLNKAASGTHNIFTSVYIAAPTIGAGTASSTNAISLYVAEAPTGATNNYALWIDAGAVRIDDNIANGSVATVMSNVGPTGANTAIQEWLKINVGGTIRYIPCW